MRTDDPAILKQIQTLEATAEALRRICGFPPLVELPETTASRKMRHWCPEGCNLGFRYLDDLEAHIALEHTHP